MDSTQEISEEEYFNGFFIGVMKKYPALYAKGNKSYQNAGKKDSLWLAVSNEVKMTIDEVKKKWKHLRDRYIKELRKVEQTATSGAGCSQVYQPKWCLYQELSFLSSHCKRRSTTSNYSFTQASEDGAETLEPVPEFIDYEGLEEVENAEPNISAVPLGTPSTTPSKRKRKSDAMDDHIHKILDMVGDVTTSVQNDQTNRHKEFCNYLGQRMSSLPMKVARDLEVEFTYRVNELLDIHTTE